MSKSLSLTHQSIGGLLKRAGLEQISQNDYHVFTSGFSISGSSRGLYIQIRTRPRHTNSSSRITAEGHLRVKILEALYEASKTLPMDVCVSWDRVGDHVTFGTNIYLYPLGQVPPEPSPGLNPKLEDVVKDYMRRSTQAELDQLGARVESARNEFESAQAFYMEISEKYAELQKELDVI